jgi:hypothetical protein
MRESKITKALISLGGSLLIRSIGATLKINTFGLDRIEKIKKNGKQIIYAFWHGKHFLLAYFFKAKRIYIFTSLHRDGEYLSGILEKLGYRTLREPGRGLRGIREVIRQLSHGGDLGIAVDGPKGPPYKVKLGIFHIAKRVGGIILPISVGVRRGKVFSKAWDRYIIPYPFTRAVILTGEPVNVSPDTPERHFSTLAKELEDRLIELDSQISKIWEKELTFKK